MKTNIAIYIVLLLFLSLSTYGQRSICDENETKNSFSENFDFNTNKSVLQFEKTNDVKDFSLRKKRRKQFFENVVLTPAPLLIGGLVFRGWDRQFFNMRHSYIPNFRSYKDTPLMYTPALAMLGLKIFGVKGRSSWGRMLVSDAFTLAFYAVTINTLKGTTKVERPDKSDNLSFPSGHTTGAFMMATMLHKEYGHRSPLYSIGGYAAATTVGVMRIMNNRHWFSDVLFGAGLGIMSTEIGYYFADLIYKKRGLYCEDSEYNFSKNNSFFGLNVGYTWMTEAHIAPNFEIEKLLGASAGIEGAWFLNNKWGIGAKVSISSMQLATLENEPESPLYGITKKDYDFDPMDFLWISAGVYRAFRLNKRLVFMAKLNAGLYHRMKTSIYPKNYVGDKPESIFEIKSQYRVMGGGGISLAYAVKPSMAFKLYADYSLVSARFLSNLYPNTPQQITFNQKSYLTQITFGFSTSILLGKKEYK